MSRWSLLLAGFCALPLHAAESAAQRFERLKSLAVGEWQGTTETGASVRVNYRTISRGTALVEIWQPGTRAETMTVFHRDGERVIATHYCAQGNQPRLALDGKGGDGFAFDYFDATDLQDGASHLHRLAFSPSGDGVQREETYRGADGDETSRLRLRRIAAAP